MLLSDKYTIYGDFEVGDHLCEYFDCKNIVFNYMITEDDGVPIIDKIPNLNDKNKKRINIAGKMRLNEWKGKKNIDFIIEDISLN